MKFLVTIGLVGFLGACGAIPTNAASDQQSVVTCSQIDDQTYTSVIDHPIGQRCGTNQDGVYLCTDYNGVWIVSFDGSDHSWFWSFGNDGDTGNYTCSKSGLALTGDGFYNGCYETLVNGTTLYLDQRNNCPLYDGKPLQSREHQYELND